MNKKQENLIKQAYTYGYPIVGMYELLYAQILNPQTRKTSFNEFAHTASIATPKTTFIPAPNNDTTYSRAWLDLQKEPVIIETPDTKDRYYCIQLLDLFSETITNIGRRLNGTKAQTFAITGPDWHGELPAGMETIACPTTLALAFLRILIHGEQDVSAVEALQQQFRIMPLSAYENACQKKVDVAKALPPCDTVSYLHFFETLNCILGLTPMPRRDAEILALMDIVGIGPNGSLQKLSEIPEAELSAACNAAVKEIDQGGLQFGEQVNFWRIARTGIGNYNADYFQRAVVWFKGALANQPEESLYPSTFQDENGEYLDGCHSYKLHFSKDSIPPVSQFWSLTMYLFQNALLVNNEIDRYSIGDRTEGLHYDEHGGLTIYIQNSTPDSAKKRANWLPAPKERFLLTLRLYGPSEAAVRGIWKPAAVQKISE